MCTKNTSTESFLRLKTSKPALFFLELTCESVVELLPIHAAEDISARSPLQSYPNIPM